MYEHFFPFFILRFKFLQPSAYMNLMYPIDSSPSFHSRTVACVMVGSHMTHCLPGRVSNPTHGQQHVGSAQRRRWLGRRPASGLWQRKDGYCGRKIKPIPPMKSYGTFKDDIPYTQFTVEGEGPGKKIIPSTNRVT